MQTYQLKVFMVGRVLVGLEKHVIRRVKECLGVSNHTHKEFLHDSTNRVQHAQIAVQI